MENFVKLHYTAHKTNLKITVLRTWLMHITLAVALVIAARLNVLRLNIYITTVQYLNKLKH